MAAANPHRMSFGSLTCSMCLEVFKKPKLLPCFHSFCEPCIRDLASQHPNNTFPCPICRKETVLPPGGVSELQTNFHIDPEDLEKAKGGSRCSRHPKKDLELCCVTCRDLPICARCIPDHQQHKTRDISEATEPAKSQLVLDNARLQRSEEEVQKSVKKLQKDQQALSEKRLAIEADIRKRHATLVAAAGQYLIESLASLDQVAEDTMNGQSSTMNSLQENLDTLAALREQIKRALDSEADSQLVSASWVMKCGRGSENAVRDLLAKHATAICRPALHYRSLTFSFFNDMRDYVGIARKMEMPAPIPDGTIAKMFQFGQDNNLEVFSICPLNDGSAWLAFEPHAQRGNLPAVRVQNGQVIETNQQFTGRVTVVPPQQTCLSSSFLFLASRPEKYATYAKQVATQMQTRSLGKSRIFSEEITCLEPRETKEISGFAVNCRAHRSFDVNADGELFAVVKEPKTPDDQRKVRLYRRTQNSSVAKYLSPIEPFRPADVCFYTLCGQEVLLVADELNDAIHVVKVQKKRGMLSYGNKWNYELSFARFLAAGCPLLVQPTALCKGFPLGGRLWIACRGGTILTFQPAVQG